MLIKTKNKCTWYGKEITQTQYDDIISMLHNMPTAPDGYAYRLTADLQWELYEMPAEEVYDEDATAEDYEAALAEMGVEV